MTTVRLKNTNPLGHVDLPLIRRVDGTGDHIGTEGVGGLEPGEVFEIDTELAGRAPSGSVETDDYDPGVGLLAQVGNYELVADPPKKSATSDATPKG